MTLGQKKETQRPEERLSLSFGILSVFIIYCCQSWFLVLWGCWGDSSSPVDNPAAVYRLGKVHSFSQQQEQLRFTDSIYRLTHTHTHTKLKKKKNPPFLSQRKSLTLIFPLPSLLQIKLYYSHNTFEKVKHLPEQRKVKQHAFIFIFKINKQINKFLLPLLLLWNP